MRKLDVDQREQDPVLGNDDKLQQSVMSACAQPVAHLMVWKCAWFSCSLFEVRLSIPRGAQESIFCLLHGSNNCKW